MVFCAAENSNGSLKSEISFPHQVELKCNDQEVKSNLRGLKNKPGSTRPADITSFLKKKIPRYQNTVEMVYALTNKVIPSPHSYLTVPACPISKSRSAYLQEKPPSQKFYMVINLVQKRPVDQLVADLRRGKFISKEQVLRESK